MPLLRAPRQLSKKHHPNQYWNEKPDRHGIDGFRGDNDGICVLGRLMLLAR